jgi:hypothetical protein
MLWTFAYTDSTAAAQTDTDIAFLADQSVVPDGANHPLLPLPLKLMWCYALGLTVTRMRINTPKFRPFARPLIRPIEGAALPSLRPQISENWRNTVAFNAVEGIQVLRTNTTGVAERDFALLTVGDGNRNVLQVDEYCMRFTTVFAPVVNVWTISGAIAFDDPLTAGQYAINGFEIGSAGAVATRLVFPGPQAGNPLPQARPGVVATTSLVTQGTRYFRHGYLGEFGRFESFQPPQIEMLNTAATANPEGYLDIVLTRPGARAA